MRAVIAALSLFAGLAAIPASAQPPADPRPPATPIHASKVILVGDSTMQATSGWGGSFCAYHLTSFVACINLARGGRSSYSYRAEGSWDLALAEMRAPGFDHVWVLIQFGHNDQPGKPGRSTDLATEFPENLRRYVTETRAAGAEPVLLTPLTRRQFRDGVLDNDLAPWADAVRAVAAEMHVPLVDLNARSAAAVQAMGPSAANAFAELPPSPEVAAAAATGTTIASSTGVAPPPPPGPQDNAAVEPLGDPKLAFDYTHLGREGADYFSAMVTQMLAEALPGMRKLLLR